MPWWVWVIGVVAVLAIIGYFMGPQGNQRPTTERDRRIIQGRADAAIESAGVVHAACQILRLIPSDHWPVMPLWVSAEKLIVENRDGTPFVTATWADVVNGGRDSEDASRWFLTFSNDILSPAEQNFDVRDVSNEQVFASYLARYGHM